MTMTAAEGSVLPAETTAVAEKRHWTRTAAKLALDLAIAYLLLLAVHAFLGQWTPDYLQGRDLWHFYLSRMVVPMVMLAFFFSFARLVPSALMLVAVLLFIGTISAIKKDSTGEPFQVSDLFLGGQGMHLLHYVTWDRWLMGALIIPATLIYLKGFRFRLWSIPLAALCLAALSTYRIEAVSKWIHDHAWQIGVENLTFSQAESERMNGLGTHLYFSMAGLRLHTYAEAEVKQALEAMGQPQPAPALATEPKPDVYIILGEAWWRDPSDKASPLDQLLKDGFAESQAVSPVYGGTTPNSEFEVLTGIPVRNFPDGIIPYQHYVGYITEKSRALPRIMSERGYDTAAYHNFTRQFWLRDQMYPKLLSRFLSMEQMALTIQPNDWPTDEGLYKSVLGNIKDGAPQFHFIVTVQTHGPYEKHDVDIENHYGVDDYRQRLDGAAKSLISFRQELDRKGRPYVIVLFGDHLPGLRKHQKGIGIVEESDPRLHQVPVLVASNARDPAAFAASMKGRPLYCLPTLVLDWIGQPAEDRYLRILSDKCRATDQPRMVPADAVIQNQIFSAQPL